MSFKEILKRKFPFTRKGLEDYLDEKLASLQHQQIESIDMQLDKYIRDLELSLKGEIEAEKRSVLMQLKEEINLQFHRRINDLQQVIQMIDEEQKISIFEQLKEEMNLQLHRRINDVQQAIQMFEGKQREIIFTQLKEEMNLQFHRRINDLQSSIGCLITSQSDRLISNFGDELYLQFHAQNGMEANVPEILENFEINDSPQQKFGGTEQAIVQELLGDAIDIEGSAEGQNKLFSLSNGNTVCVLTETFFKFDGTTFYSGGAERYLLDLYEVCKNKNLHYRVFQYADYNWVRFYGEIEVVGLKRTDTSMIKQKMDNLFSTFTQKMSVLNIYSPFFLKTHKSIVPSIGISHGIAWDHEYIHFANAGTFWREIRPILEGAHFCDQLVSVDTNTCNWVQTIDYQLGVKMHYIPNYVDCNDFSPARASRHDGKIIILYPRRLCRYRGLYLVLDVMDEILEHYPDTEIHFVGKGFDEDTCHVEKKIEKWGERVKWHSYPPDKMSEAYQKADITLIPTIHSEGTSLSCLEALASGNAVIATRIGGLTDLILDGYNGILVEPTAESIKCALIDLLDNPEKIPLLGECAVKTAKTFSKERWSSSWSDIIERTLNSASLCVKKKHLLKRCVLHIDSIETLNLPETKHFIHEHLDSGWYMFIACDNNPLKYQSFQRLQFIDSTEELYFVPEKELFAHEIQENQANSCI